MNESIKRLRLARSREFNEFCDLILAHEGIYPKSVSRELAKYRRLFTATPGDPELRELAAGDLRRLAAIEIYVKHRIICTVVYSSALLSYPYLL